MLSQAAQASKMKVNKKITGTTAKHKETKETGNHLNNVIRDCLDRIKTIQHFMDLNSSI